MHPEAEVCSMKVLLKQVYGVHTTKVKCLEDEIDELKKNLLEATNKLKNYETECKRCIELEEAFTKCKTALFEQSKMFENLGQKLSNFNQTENRTIEEKELKVLPKVIDNPISKPVIQVAPVKKLDLSINSKAHFLKNFMSLNFDENQDSLELSVPLQKNVHQEYSTLNPDSLVLVPNTMEFGCEDKGKISVDKNNDCITVCLDKPKESTETSLATESCKNIEIKERRKKRSCENDSDLDYKLDKENEGKFLSVSKKLKSALKATDEHCVPLTKVTNVTTSPNKKSNKSSGDGLDNNNKQVGTSLDMIYNLEEDVFVDDSKNSVSKNSTANGVAKDDSFQATVSPSLLPLKEKTNTKVINNPSTVAEDFNDFQVPSSSKKISNEGGTWTSCDKKKLTKKNLNLRPIKSTSRFKMQLDSLPPNFKKPSYRQTKLSKSIFQPKTTTTTKQEPDIECLEVNENFEDFAKDSAVDSPDLPTVSVSTKTVDFDATCIPDNYEYEIISSSNAATTKPKTKKDKVFPNSIMIVKDDTDSFDSDSSADLVVERKSSTSKQHKGKDSLNSKHIDVGELGNSFDRLPKKAEPNYKYKEETVRKQSERKQLNAFDCKECEKYYSDLGLPEEEKQQRMQKCSRHRSKFAPPPTPEHFWELEFPDTQECKARGYLNVTQKAKLKTHRKRPL